MFLFTVVDRVRRGLQINRENGAGLENPSGCAMAGKPLVINLSPELTDFFDSIPLKHETLNEETGEMERQSVEVFLTEADVTIKEGCLTLGAYRPTNSRQALVRLWTNSPGGLVKLTSAGTKAVTLSHGKMVPSEWYPFPSFKMQALCNENVLKQVNEGVEQLDLFVLMDEGSRFRIERTGTLVDARGPIPPRMWVHWNGRFLNLTSNKHDHPQVREDAART